MTTTPIHSPGTPQPGQTEAIRDAMSFSNLLTPHAAAASDAVAEAPVLAPPSTPKHDASSAKEEEVSSPESVLSSIADVEAEAEAESNEETAEGMDIDEDDQIEREFICKADEFTTCKTGQYTSDLARKVISDYFGRNKACTRFLGEWPLFCRKHYQRATYNKALWQIRKINLILRQFDIIEKDFPGTTYDIGLKKAEEARLNDYSRKVSSGVTEQDAMAAVAPTSGKNFEAPIMVLRELDQYLGKNKNIDEVKEVVNVILQMLQEKDTEQVPSIEFLPVLPGKTSSPKKSTAKSRSAKSSPVKSPFKSTPSRTSSKGAVKKTTQQA
ncbi:hypothetical protein P153DRAFT_395706 [Dothidotthia symphoricarpi CBS 119687]|uniref:Uncharacterized protein n=1 Tax=Dothidotthia symphoricarpi CBS 119687 TaxID=1392245 RepID=A0A6A6AH91_9PLEO|nr:uncharacterized protein P153DRAFT_395706 [Dothidotthia symphoricarpi CBS 119687]KAF2130274.1 hypothetical protein P153DRAFT_395706 [Dothidotthia symphoricarpi CBS 119687]